MSLGQFLDDLVDLAGSTITIEPYASVNADNEATYAAVVSYSAQIGGPVKYMHRESAQERVSSQTIYVFTTDQISARDRLTLPIGYDATVRTPRIQQVDRVTDELGFVYSVLFLG